MRLGLLLAELGNKHEITVAEQEMQRAVFAQARQYPGQERQFLEFVQKNPQALQQIRAPLFEEKVVDFILELAQVTEKPVSKDELQKAIEALDEEGDGARPRLRPRPQARRAAASPLRSAITRSRRAAAMARAAAATALSPAARPRARRALDVGEVVAVGQRR